MKPLFYSIVFLSALNLSAQSFDIELPYEANETNPFGLVNPNYAEQLSDFAPMIGDCNCESVNRGTDGNWNDTIDMIWRFKYIMNGTSIQDESWKSDGSYSGSIRQYIADSSAWAVTYFSSKSPAASPGVWMGGQDGDDVVLYMDQAAPNGTPGDSRLTFYNIEESGFDWKGEWMDKTGSFVYPFWTITCEKQ